MVNFTGTAKSRTSTDKESLGVHLNTGGVIRCTTVQDNTDCRNITHVLYTLFSGVGEKLRLIETTDPES